MKILYASDATLRLGSGEFYHTEGFLRSTGKHAQILYATQSPKPLSEFEDTLSFQVVAPPWRGARKWQKPLYHLWLILIALSARPDVIYIRYGPFAVISALILPFFLPNRVFIEMNGLIDVESPFRMIVGLSLIIEKLFRIHVNRVVFVAVSEGIAQELRRRNAWFPPVYVIENGASEAGDRPSPSVPDGNGSRFVFVGALTRWQDLAYLLRAVKTHANELREADVHVEIVGDGPARSAAEIDFAGFRDIVSFYGYLPHRRIAEVLGRAAAGLLIDKRLRRSMMLFSPLKYYEYRAFGIPTLFLTPKRFDSSRFPDIVGVDAEGFGHIATNLSKLPKVQPARNWDQVGDEIWRLIQMKAEDRPRFDVYHSGNRDQ